MTGFEDSGLIDSNVFIYFADSSSPYHHKAKVFVEKIISGGINPIASPQNIYEFYSIITDKKRTGNAYSQKEAREFIAGILSLPNLKILQISHQVFEKVMEFLKSEKISSRQIFDAVLAATMIANGVKTIYTLNTKDFEIFGPEIRAVDPFMK